MSDFEINNNFENSENNTDITGGNENTSPASNPNSADDASDVREFTPATENHEEKTAKESEKDPAEYTYSYGAFGTKENVTSRFEPYAGSPHGQNTGTNYTAGNQSTPYASGEDHSNSYSGGYSTYGNQSPYAQTQNNYPPRQTGSYTPQPQNPSPRKKSSGKTVKASTAILLCVACVLLSFAVSILGSTLAYKAIEADKSDNASASPSGDGVVMYRDVETKASGDTTVADIVDTVADSVVEITTEFVQSGNFFFSQYVTQGAGSGVIVSDDGYIVTNNHVICDTENDNTLANTIKVKLRNGTEYTASVVGTDADADIALIKIEASDLTPAVWGDSDKAIVGEQVLAIGNPLGSLGGTLTVGYISATSREIEVDNVKMTLIQTDAAVNPGNSGGGLFDLNGNLIGVVNAKSYGTEIDGLGFAIPSNDAKETVEQLLEYGYVKGKVFIGVSFYEYNSGFYSSFGSSAMLMVYGTEAGYNDDVLEQGDIILSMDGEEVASVADVKAILKNHKVGDKIPVSILRNKTALDVEIECYEYNVSDSEVSFEEQ